MIRYDSQHTVAPAEAYRRTNDQQSAEMANLKDAIARFGASAKAKLANPGVTGEPEDQLRAPLETLVVDLAELCGFKRQWLAAVGETSLARTFNVPGPFSSQVGEARRLRAIRRTVCRALADWPGHRQHLGHSARGQ